MTRFSLQIHNFFLQFLLKIEFVFFRVRILVNSGETELQYLISMVDMLATCAEVYFGYNMILFLKFKMDYMSLVKQINMRCLILRERTDILNPSARQFLASRRYSEFWPMSKFVTTSSCLFFVFSCGCTSIRQEAW